MSEARTCPSNSLFAPEREQGNCGVGFVVNLNGIVSHQTVLRGIEILCNLLHRGATAGDTRTGDGAGIMLQLPDDFLKKAAAAGGVKLDLAEAYGAGMVFMPADRQRQSVFARAVEQAAREAGLSFLGWRNVPVNMDALGKTAAQGCPNVKQFFIGLPAAPDDAKERRLYVLRRKIENKALEANAGPDEFYIVSLSAQLMVYKGLLMAPQLPEFYPDLLDVDLKSAIAVVHQRYSTNTSPSWRLAQPFRYLAHNGEINTLRGNIAQMAARQSSFNSGLFGCDLKELLPVIDGSGSDSACLDNALELLVNGGRDLPHAMMMLIPEAWGAKYPLGPDQRGFFEYHAGIMEPWDGPATIVFCDGTRVGAILDRNGLRPARYTICRDGTMSFASETGVLDFSGKEVEEKGSLRPGQIILADLRQKRLLRNGEIKGYYSRRQPYRRWVEENRISPRGFFESVAPITPDYANLLFRQKLFGYTREDLRLIIEPMAVKGHEAVGSMGNDAPLAVFSEKPQMLYNYFRQLFAQVTNPAIDPIREELVMSLMTFIGNPANILSELPSHSRLVKLRHPVLSNEDLYRIRNLNLPDFSTQTLKTAFPASGTGKELEQSLALLCNDGEAAVRSGRNLLILSDRRATEKGEMPIPALLAVSALNQHLVAKGLRTGAGLIVETGEAREVMHLALLLGFGATAVNPYLAFETVAALADKQELGTPIGVTQALDNYTHALCAGLLKIMSKMGISTLRSYRGAQVFEALGLGRDLCARYFGGVASRVGGIGLEEIAAEANMRYSSAHEDAQSFLPAGGNYRFRSDGERHMWSPASITKLQRATRADDCKIFREYSKLIDDQSKHLSTVRGLLRFKKCRPIPLAEVEPAENIVKKFVTGAMSFGSISREAHETIAIAMNRLKARSNSGEGGEDPARFHPRPDGDNSCSAIKQVASGRFGVTTEYLVNAADLQIKIAQGAKPGEGGQLPGHKVNDEIARVRHSTPGVTLISPPPHHDIYSIEDLAQLVFDLKNVNPSARISVKLVSELGVGTVACGVAKAQADVVLVSGGDGGTGAAPLSSIKYAGMPWELGLAETHQALIANNLRKRVRLQVDGQMRTGRDVVIAALLGAEEFGFATAALVVCGCVMMRKCHENNCPVGVATQRPDLRKRFSGKPEYLVSFFTMLAGEAREILAQLGLKTLAEAVGRVDLLEMESAVEFWKAKNMDYSALLHQVGKRLAVGGPAACYSAKSAFATKHEPRTGISAGNSVAAEPFDAAQCKRDFITDPGRQNDMLKNTLDGKLLPQIEQAINKKEPLNIETPIRNVNRSVGALIAGHIARRFGAAGLAEDAVTLRFSGSAGQSFGAFAVKGMQLVLTGEANDYLGKGLSGGKIILQPLPGIPYDPSNNSIAGNTILYGATSGEVYISGRVGERFAVRNSGAKAVVEGVGDHGCEYMTGGRVVVLGETGINFAAGMSGGLAYVYDDKRIFDLRCNLDMVDLESLAQDDDVAELRGLIEKHLHYTRSARAQYVLSNWEACLPYFVKVFPMEYRRVLGQMSREDEATQRQEPIHG